VKLETKKGEAALLHVHVVILPLMVGEGRKGGVGWGGCSGDGRRSAATSRRRRRRGGGGGARAGAEEQRYHAPPVDRRRAAGVVIVFFAHGEREMKKKAER
jgi:hypothetical protein